MKKIRQNRDSFGNCKGWGPEGERGSRLKQFQKLYSAVSKVDQS